MTLRKVCTGCGTKLTIKELRKRFPRAISCCPERKMVDPKDIKEPDGKIGGGK
jgi:hypothetical protein